MKEWTLHDEDDSRVPLLATLDESKHINAAGDRLVPLLQFHFNWERWKDNGRVSAQNQVMAISLSLYPNDGMMFFPWVQTGLLPRRNNASLSLPIPQAIIEHVTHQASQHPDHAVCLSLGMQVLARSPEGALVMYAPSRPEGIHLDAIQWRKFLVTWGYPSTRFIEVPIGFPEPLRTSSPETSRVWAVCVKALEEAHRKWTVHDVQGAGAELRRAVQFALATWDALWFPGIAKDDDPWNEFAARIGEGIPGYKNFSIPPRSDANTHRLFSRLQLLRNLSTLANSFHHIGEEPVYSPGDVNTLLTATSAVLAGLPEFWSQFPKPQFLQTMLKE